MHRFNSEANLFAIYSGIYNNTIFLTRMYNNQDELLSALPPLFTLDSDLPDTPQHNIDPEPSFGALSVTSQPGIVPLSLPALPSEPSSDENGNKSKKRRRPEKLADPEKRAARAARNRTFARESRERKKEWLGQLKKEVRELRAEVEIYRRRMSRYELIDQQLNFSSSAYYAMISEVLREQQRKGTMSDHAEFVAEITRRTGVFINERRTALSQLSRMMVQLTLPLPMRFCLWNAESGVDVYDPSADKPASNVLNSGQTQCMCNIAQTVYPDKTRYDRVRQELRGIAKDVRLDVKNLLEAHKGIQRETLRMWNHMKRDAIPKYSLVETQFHMQMMPRLELKPELSEYALYKIQDKDFWLDEGTVVSAEDPTAVLTEVKAH